MKLFFQHHSSGGGKGMVCATSKAKWILIVVTKFKSKRIKTTFYQFSRRITSKVFSFSITSLLWKGLSQIQLKKKYEVKSDVN